MTVALDVAELPTRALIGGEWVDTGSTIDVIDPATESPVTSIARASVADCLDAVGAAHDALAPWSATAPRVRGEVLRRAFELMVAEADTIATLMVRENGKVLADARAEVTYAAEFFRWFSEEAVRIEGDYRRAPNGDKWILVTQQPVGVALLITPWNFPAAMITRKVGAALAAGCTCVVKPASETPLTALYLADLLGRAGMPAGVVNVVVPRPTGEAVSAMLRDPRVRKLSFTGSTPTGRLLLAQAAEGVVRTSMELGGNAPFIVFADADLGAAVDGAMVAKMRNGGAACTAANRFYVEESVAADFTTRLAQRMGALRLGPGLDPDSHVGPLVSGGERDGVAKFVADAESAGARAIVGGSAPDRTGYYYAPTVLGDVDPDADFLAHEIFGPVAPVTTFTDIDDVVRRANDTEYGLIAYVYTTNHGKGLRVCEALESGMIGLNRGLVSDPAAPFGGFKQSGLGREGSHHGLLEFLETKYIAGTW